jgi:hypothetical protein
MSDQLPSPSQLKAMIDRACRLAEDVIGHPPDRRRVAKTVMVLNGFGRHPSAPPDMEADRVPQR